MPATLVALALILLGIAVLTAGAEALVRGAVSVAKLLRVSTAVIGLTIVAAGTSMPELTVSLLSALQGRPDIAIGNIVGSNIFNIAVILGACAMFVPLVVHGTAVRIEWPFLFALSLLFLLLARDGRIDRLEGAFLLVALIGFTAYMVRLSRTAIAAREAAELEAAVEPLVVRPQASRPLLDVGLVIMGVILLVVGADVLVRGAVRLAEIAGVSERVIGLTIVAAGTSMPELATSLVAARRQQPDIALANVLGSNIFNIAGIVGPVSLITPQRVHPQMIASDNWWMLAMTLVLWPVMRTGMRISRWEGALLLAGYGLYLWLLL
jgi:cation:H+ antiporter